jgi:hypothetical protein
VDESLGGDLVRKDITSSSQAVVGCGMPHQRDIFLANGDIKMHNISLQSY